jgi:hypothetical protein
VGQRSADRSVTASPRLMWNALLWHQIKRLGERPKINLIGTDAPQLRKSRSTPSSRGAQRRGDPCHRGFSGPDGLLAALALRASLRLFDALRALVPRYARNDRIPMVHSLRSFRGHRENKSVPVTCPEWFTRCGASVVIGKINLSPLRVLRPTRCSACGACLRRSPVKKKLRGHQNLDSGAPGAAGGASLCGSRGHSLAAPSV